MTTATERYAARLEIDYLGVERDLNRWLPLVNWMSASLEK